MNKKDKLIILYVIIGLGLLLLGAKYLAIFPSNMLLCSVSSPGFLSCSVTGEGGQQGLEQTFGTPIVLEITYLDRLLTDEAFYKPVLLRDVPELTEFFQNTYCSRNGYSVLYNTNYIASLCPGMTEDQCGNIFYPFVEKWKNSDLSTQHKLCSGCGCGGIGNQYGDQWYFTLSAGNIASKWFKNQLATVDGNFIDIENGNRIPFKIYGLCQLDTGICTLQEPANVPTSTPTHRYNAEITSFKITLKAGGYDLENSCFDYGIEKCEGETLFTCQPNSWVSAGKVEGKCGYIIEIPSGSGSGSGSTVITPDNEEDTGKGILISALVFLVLVLIGLFIYLLFKKRR